MDWCPLRDLPQSSRNGKAINAEVDFLELAKNIIERDADDEWFLQQECEVCKNFHTAKKYKYLETTHPSHSNVHEEVVKMQSS